MLLIFLFVAVAFVSFSVFGGWGWGAGIICLIYMYIKSKVRLALVLKTFFINVSFHILVAGLTLMALFKKKTEPTELDYLQVYEMTQNRAIRVKLATSL